MLPADERLRRANVFQRAYSGRQSISNQLAILYVLPKNRPQHGKQHGHGSAQTQPQTGHAPGQELLQRTALARPLGRLPLVGFVMAKKVCKSACKRNRARRRFREAYRKMRLAMRLQTIVPSNHEDAETSFPTQLRQTQPDQWYAVVWVLNEKALTATWLEVQSAIVETFRKADQKFGRSKKAEKK